MTGRDNDEICQRYAIPKLEQVSIMYKALRSKYGTLQGWSKISISHQPTVWIWFGLTDEVFIVKKKNNNNVIKSEGRKKTEKPRDNSDLTYTLRFKGSLKEFEIELSGMNIHCTINHNGQKTLHETAGGKKEKTEAWVGVFRSTSNAEFSQFIHRVLTGLTASICTVSFGFEWPHPSPFCVILIFSS